MIIFGQRSFSFEDLNCYLFLVILISGENLRFFGWDKSTSWDDGAHDSSNGFNS